MSANRLATVKLYGRPDCHLCEEARKGLEALRLEGVSFALVEVDIESDDELFKRMLERIPVIEAEGEVVCELGLDAAALMRRLATVSP